MTMTPNEWTLEGFVSHFDFVHHKMLDHKYVWVLGAGASLASGIPVGSQLVNEWLKEMHLREDTKDKTLEEWATVENLDIVGFKFPDRASFYPKIYQRRFQDYPDEGFAYLESVMSGRDPSPGYSILAAALAEDPPRHNVVITTNFDNLVADALSIYTDTFPFIAGHESLTGFVRVAMRRPLICKIHRDLLLGPQNDPRSMRRLHDAWGTALRALFLHYTPLFIGYGGNDDTLMDLLESMQPADIKGQLIWCYYEKSKPSERIVNVVTDLKGVLVPVPDFDLLMVLLGEKIGISTLDEEIGRRANERTERYRERIQRLDTVDHPSVAEALAATLERSGGWWAWDQKARLEDDPVRCETVYWQGIQHCPASMELHGNFANFMWKVRNNPEEADRLYRKALELDPKGALHTGNFAIFMSEVQGNHDEAEKLYRKALELDPKNVNVMGNFAAFMKEVRRNHDEAEKLYRKALELEPKDAFLTGNFANFMNEVRGNHDEAEKLYRKALELDLKDANVTGGFASFMSNVRENPDEAEKLYRKALELDPQNTNVMGNFASFMNDLRGDHDEAETLYRKALELDPKHANNTGNFASFMSTLRGDHDEAEKLYRKALELDPTHANNTANFADFLTAVRGNYDEAEKFYRKALELNPQDANIAGGFAVFMDRARRKPEEAERLFRNVIELDPNNANNMGNYAAFLLAQGRLGEAGKFIERAKALNSGQVNQLAAELLLYEAILARVSKEDDTRVISDLKTLLSQGFSRTPWSFDDSLAYVRTKLPANDHALFSAVAAGILDAQRVPDFEALLRKRVQPTATRSLNGKKRRKAPSQPPNGQENGQRRPPRKVRSRR